MQGGGRGLGQQRLDGGRSSIRHRTARNPSGWVGGWVGRERGGWNEVLFVWIGWVGGEIGREEGGVGGWVGGRAYLKGEGLVHFWEGMNPDSVCVARHSDLRCELQLLSTNSFITLFSSCWVG